MPVAIDIICSAKNAGPRFGATIDSVLAQTYRDYRLIIVDDGSDDGVTGRIAEEAARRGPRVHVSRNEMSLGLTANLVRAVGESNAEFIARIDAGDLWRPEKLAKQIAAMRMDEAVIVLGTQCEYISTEGRLLGRSRFAESDEGIRQSIGWRRGIFSHPSILFRRIINYRPEFVFSQDLDLYLRASEMGRLQCLPEALTICLISRFGITVDRNYLQRKYVALAHRSYRSRLHREGDIVLRVTDSALERELWRIARPFYLRYVNARLHGSSPLVWGGWLLATMAIFPPMILDYAKKL